MSAIGSLIFCRDCGNLLNESTGDETTILTCDICGAKNKDRASKTIVSESKANAFPSALLSKRSAVRTLTAEEQRTDVAIKQTCSACGNPEMRFYTQQLRSADEGTTVFFSCECGYK
ncbi:DNA-directed RNA polymerase I core subunit rpa12 [Myotisia sp. PD_48]|nr:DNA-directed RNA polymerase I core subunit rpa12 [Myotisia sp. PD_48]